MTLRVKALKRVLKVAYVVAVAVLILFALRNVEMSWRSLLLLLVMPQAWGFISAWILMAVGLGCLWSLWLRWRNELHMLPKEWISIQALAWSGRYLPGKIGLLAGKLSLVGRSGLGYRDLGLSVLVEQLSFVAMGFIVGVALVNVHSLGSPSWLPAWAVTNAPLLKLTTIVVVGSMAIALIRVLDRTLSSRAGLALPIGRLCIFLALHTAPHLLVGLGFAWFVSGVFPDFASLPYLHVIGLLALAHAAGSIAVFAPAGIGVRELVLASGFAATLSFEQALLLATLARVLTLLADAALLILVGAWRMSRRRSSA